MKVLSIPILAIILLPAQFSLAEENYHTGGVNISFLPVPCNETNLPSGEVDLSVKFLLSDNVIIRNANISFHEWPSKRVIGYQVCDIKNGTIVNCPATFYCPYKGTKYYWFVCANSSNFSISSPIWLFKTAYNDLEPATVYYSLGAQISIVNPFKLPSSENVSENEIATYDDLVEKEIELAGLAVDLFILTIFALFIVIIYSRFSLSLLLKRLFQTR